MVKRASHKKFHPDQHLPKIILNPFVPFAVLSCIWHISLSIPLYTSFFMFFQPYFRLQEKQVWHFRIFLIKVFFFFYYFITWPFFGRKIKDFISLYCWNGFSDTFHSIIRERTQNLFFQNGIKNKFIMVVWKEFEVKWNSEKFCQ